MAWIKVKGGWEGAAMWRANFNIPSLDKNISCKTKVFPIDMSNDAIIDSGDCLILAEREVKRFFGVGKIQIDVNINMDV